MNTQSVETNPDDDTEYAMTNFIKALDSLKQNTNTYYVLGLLIKLQKELVLQGNKWTPDYSHLPVFALH